MVKKISLFNHKGGVSKTTTTFNLAWKLADLGKRVIMVDADPQCNLTGMVFGLKKYDDFQSLYQGNNRDIASGLAPAFESRPEPMKAVECMPVRENLFLLPGHIKLSEYDVTLSIAQELSSSLIALRNLPGSFTYLLNKTADAYSADYILIDLNPSLSATNRNFLMTSDYFLVPTSPDYFSLMAIDSLSRVLPDWCEWSKRAQGMNLLKDASYPFPQVIPRFLGTVIQKFRPRGRYPAQAFLRWIHDIQEGIQKKLVPALALNGMMLNDIQYQNAGISKDYTLSIIPDFNSLIAISQEQQTPIYALTKDQLGQQGVVYKQTQESQAEFSKIFIEFADRILKLTMNASGA